MPYYFYWRGIINQFGFGVNVYYVLPYPPGGFLLPHAKSLVDGAIDHGIGS
jgi:hypothetical protein